MIKLEDLSAEQLEELAAKALEKKKKEAQEQRENRKAYKELVADKVDNAFSRLEEISERLMQEKQEVIDEFEEAMEIKRELYDVKDNQMSHTFSSANMNKRITIGFYSRDDWDDTVNEGIAKVKEILSSYADNPRTKALVKMMTKLLSRDTQGNLKAKKVLELRTMANELNDEDLLKAIEIIQDAHRPVRTKTYIKAEYKDHMGVWRQLPLSMTEATIIKEKKNNEHASK